MRIVGKLSSFTVVAVVAGIFVLQFLDSGLDGISQDLARTKPVKPNWAAIAAWPPEAASDVEAVPDPNRNYTVIVLDDSGSMGDQIVEARAAVLTALEEMQAQDRVSVIALNAAEIIPFMAVDEARGLLPARIAEVNSSGTTPLTSALKRSRGALAAQAANAGGFGTYRILVTTDGQADDGEALTDEIESIARETPIQVATIGLGIRGNHVLRRTDLAAFVSIDDVSQLAQALRNAIAEEQTFSAITSFGDR